MMKNPPNKDEQKQMHIALLKCLVSFCHQQGIESWKGVVSAKLQATLDQPLWKLLELNGKYCQDYISEGVYLIEEKTGRQVTKSTGKWQPEALRNAYPNLEIGKDISADPRFRCHLEHVTSRKALISKLISQEISVEEIVEKHLLGCVILAEEHRRLGLESDSLDDPWRKYREASPPVRVWSRSAQSWVVDC